MPAVRRLNDEIRRNAPAGAAPFICECGESCVQTVWLDAPDFDRVARAPGVSVLAAGHLMADDLAGANRVTKTGSSRPALLPITEGDSSQIA